MPWAGPCSSGGMESCGSGRSRPRCIGPVDCTCAGIGAWNTVYLGQALVALAAEGPAVPAEYLPHIAPLGWEHIKGLGHYSFAPEAPGALERLRPLRNAADSNSMEEAPTSAPARQARQRAVKRPGTAPTRVVRFD